MRATELVQVEMDATPAQRFLLDQHGRRKATAARHLKGPCLRLGVLNNAARPGPPLDRDLIRGASLATTGLGRAFLPISAGLGVREERDMGGFRWAWLTAAAAGFLVSVPGGLSAQPASGVWELTASRQESFPACPGSQTPGECSAFRATTYGGGEGSLTIRSFDRDASGHWTGTAGATVTWQPPPRRLMPGSLVSTTLGITFEYQGNRAYSGGIGFVTADGPHPARSCAVGWSDGGGFPIVNMLTVARPGSASDTSTWKVPPRDQMRRGFQIKVCAKADGQMTSWLYDYAWQAATGPTSGASPAAPTPGKEPSPPRGAGARGTSGMNVADAASKLNAIAGDRFNGLCAKHVQQALEAGGVSGAGHPAYARQYGPYLLTRGFVAVPQEQYQPQKGDIVVIQPSANSAGPGHIAMYDGSQWISDHRQKSFWGSSDQPNPRRYRFYRP